MFDKYKRIHDSRAPHQRAGPRTDVKSDLLEAATNSAAAVEQGATVLYDDA
jgi:hypothetical protein